ncbi:LytR/AlgR family response regulator transcription factor [Rufibacter glacialis]|uniref:Response regulator transcription factor n=1 Tax=Rufibacter glacialis TaxID=1259555 RepID=A0A5M8QBP2_9BACT|nr:LytTR family DNA-binding domain-containing protein [Rufibacter glacialis]KAA6433417.1 response regulator transcription factor [Rufibacter glacialis]GGK74399.1 DNA-binding response regulator [Rufibacter glacialis]
MRCIALDDEPIALAILQDHGQKVPFLQLEATFVSATEALAYLRQHPIDLIFLDIKMPDITGVEVAKLIGKQTSIIFTTAFSEYALDGFDLAVTDYLLKPITFPRFLQACTRAQEQQQKSEATTGDPAPEYLFVKVGYDWERINLTGLLYIEADDNYLTFHEPQRRTLTRMTLAEAQEKLPEEQFAKVHRSFLVAIDKIEKIERHQVTLGGKCIPVSPSYRESLLQRLL